MNKLIITVILLFTFVVSALAQDTAQPEATAEAASEAAPETAVSNTGNPLYCEGAQEWYDEATVDIQDLVSTSVFWLHQTPSSLELQSEYSRFRESQRRIRDLKYPECVEWARNRLLSAYNKFLEGMELFNDGKAGTGEEVLAIGVGVMMYGNVDGYMMSLGVRTHISPPQS